MSSRAPPERQLLARELPLRAARFTLRHGRERACHVRRITDRSCRNSDCRRSDWRRSRACRHAAGIPGGIWLHPRPCGKYLIAILDADGLGLLLYDGWRQAGRVSGRKFDGSRALSRNSRNLNFKEILFGRRSVNARRRSHTAAGLHDAKKPRVSRRYRFDLRTSCAVR
jgi:hypothetical protein